MTKIIVVTPGKDDVGKTTTNAASSAGLTLRDHKTAVVDFDVGLHNLDLIMGYERHIAYDLINMIHGKANPNQALIKGKKCGNLFTLPTSQTRDKGILTREDVEKVIEGLKEMGSECTACDSPADIESGALMAMYFADEVIVVTSPEVSLVYDSDRILGILSSKSRHAVEDEGPIKEHSLLTHYNPKCVSEGEMLSLTDIQEILRTRLIDVIPESEAMLQASNQGLSAIHLEGSDAVNAYHDVIDHFLGKEKKLRYVEYNKPGFLQCLFGGGKWGDARPC